MTPIQQKMFDLLLEIDALCSAHDIPYYMAGGSVLGAVRHHGFIPWDDDIDICMTREAFAAFEAVCAEELSDDRELITTENTPCHTKVTIKFMDKTSTQFFRSQVLDTTGCGVSLDIFVLDPLPKDPAAFERQMAAYIVYNELLTPFFMVNENLYKVVPLYRQLHRRVKMGQKKQVMAELYRQLFVEEPAESDRYLYRWGQQHLIYDRDLFGTPVRIPFEGHLLPVPEKTLDFLRATYGDGWKYIPPASGQETHTSTMNTVLAYRNMLDDIMPQMPRKKALRDFERRKAKNVDRAVPQHEVTADEWRYRCRLTERILSGQAYTLDLIRGMRDDERIAFLKPYWECQLAKVPLAEGMRVAVEPELRALLCDSLIAGGQYLKAEKLLRTVPEAERDERVKDQLALIERIRTCNRAFEDGEPERVAELLPAWFAEAPYQLDLTRDLLRLALWQHKTDAMLPIVEKAIKRYPNDGELCLIAAKVLVENRRFEQAVPLLQKAADTDNGMVLLERQAFLAEWEDNDDGVSTGAVRSSGRN